MGKSIKMWSHTGNQLSNSPEDKMQMRQLRQGKLQLIAQLSSIPVTPCSFSLTGYLVLR